MIANPLNFSSAQFLGMLAESAARALALGCVAAIALGVLRVKSVSLRLMVWKTVLAAALLMPLLGIALPKLPLEIPILRPATANAQPNAFVATTAPAKAPAAVQLFSLRADGSPASVTLMASRHARKLAKKELATGAAALGSLQNLENFENLANARNAIPQPGTSVAGSLWARLRTISGTNALLAMYLAVAFFFLARMILGWFWSRRLARAAAKIDDRELLRRFRLRSFASGLECVPSLAESEVISAPVAIGVWRPAILLPADWREWDEAKLDAILAHEISHIARRDALTQRLTVLYRAIFWFNPLAWWLDHAIARLAEEASDEAALAGGADRNRYAETLLGFFADVQAAPGRVWWQGVSMARGGRAEERVERILAWKGAKQMRIGKFVAVAALAAAVPLVLLSAAVHPRLVEAQSATTPTQSPAPAAPQAAPKPATAPKPSVTPTPAITPSPAPASQPAPRATPVAPAAPTLPPPVMATPSVAPAPPANVFSPAPPDDLPALANAPRAGVVAPPLGPPPAALALPSLAPGDSPLPPAVAPGDVPEMSGAPVGGMREVPGIAPKVADGPNLQLMLGGTAPPGMGLEQQPSAQQGSQSYPKPYSKSYSQSQYGAGAGAGSGSGEGWGWQSDSTVWVLRSKSEKGKQVSLHDNGCSVSSSSGAAILITEGGKCQGWSETYTGDDSFVAIIGSDALHFRDGDKKYIIRDPETIAKAHALCQSMMDFGRQQSELGREESLLGEKQSELGRAQSEVRVRVPDMQAELDQFKARLKELDENGGTQSELSEMQAELANLQSQLGRLQARAGEQQAELEQQQAALGAQQAALGAQQAGWGQKQSEAARRAMMQLKDLLKDAIARGQAKPE
jgi:beta-lactamase regulating signal transducer with metallopeptidase domain